MSILKKTIISIFIIFNFLIMMRIHLPLNHSAIREIYRPVDSYLTFFSIYQDWMMFAPNPGKINSHITAEIEFFDGSTDTYHFPRGRNLTIGQKYLYGEKYRKFLTESFDHSDKSFLWEDAAKFALRKTKNQNFSRIPKMVHLSSHWERIAEMNKNFRKHLAHQSVFKTNKFYTYEVIK